MDAGRRRFKLEDQILQGMNSCIILANILLGWVLLVLESRVIVWLTIVRIVSPSFFCLMVARKMGITNGWALIWNSLGICLKKKWYTDGFEISEYHQCFMMMSISSRREAHSQFWTPDKNLTAALCSLHQIISFIYLS